MQMWGGMGYTLENVASAQYRDGRLASIGGGADEIMLQILCKMLNILPKGTKLIWRRHTIHDLITHVIYSYVKFESINKIGSFYSTSLLGDSWQVVSGFGGKLHQKAIFYRQKYYQMYRWMIYLVLHQCVPAMRESRLLSIWKWVASNHISNQHSSRAPVSALNRYAIRGSSRIAGTH